MELTSELEQALDDLDTLLSHYRSLRFNATDDGQVQIDQETDKYYVALAKLRDGLEAAAPPKEKDTFNTVKCWNCGSMN